MGLAGQSQWLTNFEEGQKQANEQHHSILLNFSGSDWCMPCMKMKKDVFETADFKKYADDNLILINADFPRRKTKLPKEQKAQNDQLAERYNTHG